MSAGAAYIRVGKRDKSWHQIAQICSMGWAFLTGALWMEIPQCGARREANCSRVSVQGWAFLIAILEI